MNEKEVHNKIDELEHLSREIIRIENTIQDLAKQKELISYFTHSFGGERQVELHTKKLTNEINK